MEMTKLLPKKCKACLMMIKNVWRRQIQENMAKVLSFGLAAQNGCFFNMSI